MYPLVRQTGKPRGCTDSSDRRLERSWSAAGEASPGRITDSVSQADQTLIKAPSQENMDGTSGHQLIGLVKCSPPPGLYHKTSTGAPGFPRPVGSHATAVFIGASVLTKDWSPPLRPSGTGAACVTVPLQWGGADQDGCRL